MYKPLRLSLTGKPLLWQELRLQINAQDETKLYVWDTRCLEFSRRKRP